MTKPQLWIATNNRGKSQEYKTMLPDYEIKTLVDLPDTYTPPLENGQSFAENALIKAQHLADYSQSLAIGDDSGICVQALDGFPGVYSRRWAAPVGDDFEISKMLLEKLEASNSKNRAAKFVTCIALVDPKLKLQKTFEGVVEGELAQQVERGLSEGFGYDCIFQPKPQQKTYSQLGQKFKDQFSARKLAIAQLEQFIKEHKVGWTYHDSKN